jgi:TPR repeat protein
MMMGELMMHSQRGSTQKALVYFDKACKKGDGEACSKYAYYHKSNTYTVKDLPLAINAYTKACKNDRIQCVSLGDAYAKGELGLKVNYAKAKEYYDRACKGKSAIGCYRLGNLYYKGHGVKKSYAKAKVYYGQSCSSNHLNGSERGCNNLAVLYHYGRGVKKNIAKAKMYYKKACGKRYDKACKTLKFLK